MSTHSTLAPSIVASTLVDGALVNGGATVWLSIPIEAGYLVGIPKYSLTLGPRALGLEHLSTRVVARWSAPLINQQAHVAVATLGSWRDPATGVYSFDACDWHADRECALALGALRGETAIWDIAAGVAVDVACVA